MQQCFHPSEKHLLYRYVTSSFAGHFFRVNVGETWYFLLIYLCAFGFCLISNVFSCRYASVVLRMILLKLSFHLLKSDDKPEKFDCDKTELSGTTDRSHKTTVTRRLGMQKSHCRLAGYVCRPMHAGADKGRLKGHIFHPPAVKIY